MLLYENKVVSLQTQSDRVGSLYLKIKVPLVYNQNNYFKSVK